MPSLENAMDSESWSSLNRTVQEELVSFEENRTWKLVEDSGVVNIIPCK